MNLLSHHICHYVCIFWPVRYIIFSTNSVISFSSVLVYVLNIT